MNLARGKNGQIARQIPSSGFDAQVSPVQMGERRGDLYISPTKIDEDQAYWAQKENEERAFNQAKAIANKVRRRAQELQHQEKARLAEQFQSAAAYDPMNEKLKAHFARRAMMGETEIVAESMLPDAPADFSASGANPQYEWGERMTGGDQWRADFRQHLITGSPLTRDGVYGPAVTDYDRFVNGVDVNQTDVVQDAPSDLSNVAGGTMLGRYNGGPAPSGMGHQHLANRRNVQHFGRHQQRGIGFDWSWGGVADAFSDVASQTADNVLDSLPDQLAKELQNAIGGGGKATQSGNTITVQRQVAGAVNTVSQTIGLPPWAIYAGLGMIGVGTLFLVIKAVKS